MTLAVHTKIGGGRKLEVAKRCVMFSASLAGIGDSKLSPSNRPFEAL